jgi:hypothetical protein
MLLQANGMVQEIEESQIPMDEELSKPLEEKLTLPEHVLNQLLELNQQ